MGLKVIEDGVILRLAGQSRGRARAATWDAAGARGPHALLLDPHRRTGRRAAPRAFREVAHALCRL